MEICQYRCLQIVSSDGYNTGWSGRGGTLPSPVTLSALKHCLFTTYSTGLPVGWLQSKDKGVNTQHEKTNMSQATMVLHLSCVLRCESVRTPKPDPTYFNSVLFDIITPVTQHQLNGSANHDEIIYLCGLATVSV